MEEHLDNKTIKSKIFQTLEMQRKSKLTWYLLCKNKLAIPLIIFLAFIASALLSILIGILAYVLGLLAIIGYISKNKETLNIEALIENYKLRTRINFINNFTHYHHTQYHLITSKKPKHFLDPIKNQEYTENLFGHNPPLFSSHSLCYKNGRYTYRLYTLLKKIGTTNKSSRDYSWRVENLPYTNTPFLIEYPTLDEMPSELNYLEEYIDISNINAFIKDFYQSLSMLDHPSSIIKIAWIESYLYITFDSKDLENQLGINKSLLTQEGPLDLFYDNMFICSEILKSFIELAKKYEWSLKMD